MLLKILFFGKITCVLCWDGSRFHKKIKHNLGSLGKIREKFPVMKVEERGERWRKVFMI
jgi:hypothetical protein